MTTHPEPSHTTTIAARRHHKFCGAAEPPSRPGAEQVFAAFFGAGYAYDALLLPSEFQPLKRPLCRRGTEFSFITVFTDYRTKQGNEATWKLANNVITALMVIVGQ